MTWWHDVLMTWWPDDLMTGSFADDWPYDILILSSTRFYTLPYLHAIKIYDNNFSCCVKSSILVLKKQMAKWWPTFLSFFWWLTISTAIWALVIGDTEPRSNNCSAPHLVNVVSKVETVTCHCIMIGQQWVNRVNCLLLILWYWLSL